MKLIDAAVNSAVTDAAQGKFDATPYVGTLENGGVGIAPYHDLDSQVPADLKAEVDQLKADIISGKIKVESRVLAQVVIPYDRAGRRATPGPARSRPGPCWS